MQPYAKPRRLPSWLIRQAGEVTLNLQRAEAVKYMIEKFLAGWSDRQIAQGLTAAHIPTWGGAKQWPQATVCTILGHERLYLPPAIISREQFNSLQQMRRSKQRITGRRVASGGNLLCGLLVWMSAKEEPFPVVLRMVHGQRKLTPKIRFAFTQASPSLIPANRPIEALARRRRFLWSYDVFLRACLELTGDAIDSCTNTAELKQRFRGAIKHVALQFSSESDLSARRLFSRTMEFHRDAGSLVIARAVPKRQFSRERFLHYHKILERFRSWEELVRLSSLRIAFIRTVENFFIDDLVVGSGEDSREILWWLLGHPEARWLQLVWREAPDGHEVSLIGLVIGDQLRAVVRRRDNVDYWQIRALLNKKTKFNTLRLTAAEIPPDPFLPPLKI